MPVDTDLLRRHIRDIPDFPKPGIVFKDITPLLLDPAALGRRWRGSPSGPRRATCATSWPPRRAASSSAGRSRPSWAPGSSPRASPGSCPSDTVSAEYALEYGIDALEVHADALAHGQRVLVHDDLLATGGTAAALAELVQALGGEVAGCAFLVELSFLGGRDRLRDLDVHALVEYDAE